MKTRAQIFKKLLSALLVLLLAATGASADLLFTRQTTYSDPVSLGIISGSDAPFSPLQSNMGGNQGNGIRPFLDAEGKLRIALTFYTGVGGSTTDVVDVFDPGPRSGWTKPSNWDRPLKQFTCSVKNIRAMATIGNCLYAAGYDRAVVSRIVMTNDAYAENKVWTHPDPRGKHGEGLFSYGGYLYAIFTDTSGDPMQPSVEYGPNQIWKFDKDLNVIASADMIGRNMDGQNDGVYTRVGSKLYVCSFGGYQVTDGGYNEKTTIEVCDLETLKSTLLARGEETHARFPEWYYMFSGLAFINGRVFLHGTTWTAPEGVQGSHQMVVYETTEEKLASGDIGMRIGSFAGSYGIQMGFNYDPETGYLWARAGDGLARYDGGSSWTLFSAADLKGTLSAAAPISALSSSGGGTIIPASVPVELPDVSVSGAEMTVTSVNADAPEPIARAVNDGSYPSIVQNGTAFASLKPLNTISASMDGSAAAAAFTIKNFDYEPAAGASLWAMVRKKAGLGGGYDTFPASLKDKTLSFEITEPGLYFAPENVVVIAESTSVEIPAPEKPWEGDGAGTGGCNSGAGALPALAALPAAAAAGRRKRGRGVSAQK